MKNKIYTYKKNVQHTYKIKPESVFMLGSIPKEMVPELKIRYTKGKRFLGIINNVNDVSEFLRKVYPKSQIELQEIVVVIFLNKRNQILGYNKHSIGAITDMV